MISRFSANILTDSSGNATVYVGPHGLSGRIHAIKFASTNLTNGHDANVTGEKTGVLIMENDTVVAGSSVTTWFYPRAVPVLDTDGTSDFTNVPADIHICEERIKVFIEGGGTNKTGKVTVFIDDGR